MRHYKLLAVLGIAISFAPASHAGVILTAQEVGNNVVMSGGGTLDLSRWDYIFSAFGLGAAVQPNEFALVGATPDLFSPYFPNAQTGFTGPAMIGPGTQLIAANNSTGDFFGLMWGPTSPVNQVQLVVYFNYVSGSPLSGSSTWSNQTLSSLGITPGVYTWTWNTSAGTDFFTINVVPAPGAAPLFAMTGAIHFRRRRD